MMKKKIIKIPYCLYGHLIPIVIQASIIFFLFTACRSTPKDPNIAFSSTATVKHAAIKYLNDYLGVFQTKWGDTLNETHLRVVNKDSSFCISVNEVYPDTNWAIDQSVWVLQNRSGLLEVFSFDTENGLDLYPEIRRFMNLLAQLPDTCSSTIPLCRYFIQRVKNLEEIDSISFKEIDFNDFKQKLFNLEGLSNFHSLEDRNISEEECHVLWTKLDSITHSSHYKNDLKLFAGRGVEFIFFLEPINSQFRPLIVWYRPSLFQYDDYTINFVIQVI